MSLFARDRFGRLIPVNPGLPLSRGNQGGMGRRLDESGLMATLPDGDLAGAMGPGVVPGGEQSVGARRVKLAMEEAPPPAPTYRPLGGAQQNNRGNARIVTLATLAGSAAQHIPSIVETPKASGDDAEALTFSLATELPAQLQDPTSTYASTPVDITALLEWGIGGAFFSAEVDWNQGMAFAICASFARISARIGAIPALGVADIPISLKASIAYGNAYSLSISSPARRTIPMLPLVPAAPGSTSIPAGGLSVITPIPLWAVGCTVVDANITAPNYTVSLFSDAVGTLVSVYKVVSRENLALQVEGQFPIPGRARFIQITNNLGVASSSPLAIFNLGL